MPVTEIRFIVVKIPCMKTVPSAEAPFRTFFTLSRTTVVRIAEPFESLFPNLNKIIMFYISLDQFFSSRDIRAYEDRTVGKDAGNSLSGFAVKRERAVQIVHGAQIVTAAGREHRLCIESVPLQEGKN